LLAVKQAFLLAYCCILGQNDLIALGYMLEIEKAEKVI